MNPDTTWLPLNEYANRYRISVSTLRRRIKNNEIKFSFTDGKYFITDEPLTSQRQYHRPSQSDEILNSQPRMESPKIEELPTPDITQAQAKVAALDSQVANEPVFTAANRLLNELKRAYTLVLQEKEEQILLLKEEISDLKTLVRILEDENRRLIQR